VTLLSFDSSIRISNLRNYIIFEYEESKTNEITKILPEMKMQMMRERERERELLSHKALRLIARDIPEVRYSTLVYACFSFHVYSE